MFGAQVEWTEELARYLLVWVGIVGAAAAFARKKHLGLDILVLFFPESSRRKTAIIADIVCLFFTFTVFLYGGTLLTIQAFEIYHILPALRIPYGFVFLALPVAGVFMAVFQFESLLRALYGNPDAANSLEQPAGISQGISQEVSQGELEGERP
jgi:TRAP-type C4-dicarboxylate transport system permease small subunit